MPAFLEPACEGCGYKSQSDKEALVRAGLVNHGPQPEIRALILCLSCREIQAGMINGVKEAVELAENPQPV